MQEIYTFDTFEFGENKLSGKSLLLSNAMIVTYLDEEEPFIYIWDIDNKK